MDCLRVDVNPSRVSCNTSFTDEAAASQKTKTSEAIVRVASKDQSVRANGPVICVY